MEMYNYFNIIDINWFSSNTSQSFIYSVLCDSRMFHGVFYNATINSNIDERWYSK
jgi:hypothetical protein